MQNARKNEMAVGIFVLIAVGLLLGMTFRIRGTTGIDPYEVKAIFPDVAGLEIGGPVLVSGFRVGRVSQMEPTRLADGEPAVMVYMEIARDIPLYRNATARLAQQGFIGDKRVEVKPGNVNSGQIETEGFMLESITSGGIEDVLSSVGDVGAEAQATLQAIRELVTDEERLARIDDTIATIQEAVLNINRSATKLEEMLQENRETVRQTLANVEQVSEKSNRIADRADELVATTQQEVQNVTQLAEDAVQELRTSSQQLITRVDRIVERADTVSNNANELLVTGRREVEELSARVDEITANLNDIVLAVKQGEGTVGRFIQDPRPFEDLQESIAALRAILLREQNELYGRSLPYRMPADNAPVEN